VTPEEVTLSRRRLVRRQLESTSHWKWRRGQADVDDGAAGAERPHRQWSSRLLHRIGAATSHAWAGAFVAIIAAGWVAYGAISGFPSYWQGILESVTSIVTVVMLFAIQHLQARDQLVTQRKLDELLRAVPQADNQLIAVEGAPDEELEVLTELNRQDRIEGH
jgi:low affinity Fe/Cu permease